jgi:hypothetical protein
MSAGLGRVALVFGRLEYVGGLIPATNAAATLPKGKPFNMINVSVI